MLAERESLRLCVQAGATGFLRPENNYVMGGRLVDVSVVMLIPYLRVNQ